MSFQTYPLPDNFRYQSIASAGTYTLPNTISPGNYRVTTDTTQNITAAFLSSNGTRYNFVVRGGEGYASIPFTATQILVPAGATYPILIGWEPVSAATQLSAPTGVASAWTSRSTGTVTFTLPAGAVSASLINISGTVIPLGSSSPITLTQGSNTNALIANNSLNGVVVGIDAFGSNGNGAAVTATNAVYLSAPTGISFSWSAGGSFATFTFTPPAGSTNTRVEWQTGETQLLTNTSPSTIEIPTGTVASGTSKNFSLSSTSDGTNWGILSAAQSSGTRPAIVNAVTTFNNSGTFTVPTGVNTLIDVIVVAGGGGAGGRIGGGGGAGGVQYATNISVTPSSNFTITIGAGGAAAGGEAKGATGSDSSFGNTVIAKGGGGGAAFSNTLSIQNGLPGGSGGGGMRGGNPANNGTGGTATAGTGGTFYGFAGGPGDGNGVPGGGGGAGQVGGSGAAGGGANPGGNGVTLLGTTYGGGGGSGSTGSNGGAGGSGGGGTAGQGTDGLGGGGGALPGQNSPGGRGGNGRVVLTYKN